MKNIEPEIIKAIETAQNVVAIYLFGSHAKGTANESSDIDVGVVFFHANIPQALELLQLQQNLSDKLHKDVDLVCMNTASPIINMQIIEFGKLLKQNDEKTHTKFICAVFTDYADLKIIRKPLEDKILDRKFFSDKS